MAKSVTAWHFLVDDGMTRYTPRVKVEVGQTLTFDGEPRLCEQGLHASRRAIDALRYAPGAIICRVRLSGVIAEGADKLVATKRTVLWMADATETLHRFACDEAERALDAQEKRKPGSVDARSRKAIEVKRLWLEGGATKKQLAAASAAASAAAYAASDAAYAAYAASDAYAAASAASDAAYAAQNKRLEKALMKLNPNGKKETR